MSLLLSLICVGLGICALKISKKLYCMQSLGDTHVILSAILMVFGVGLFMFASINTIFIIFFIK